MTLYDAPDTPTPADGGKMPDMISKAPVDVSMIPPLKVESFITQKPSD